MSKMDDLRRMREAAHDQAMARKSNTDPPVTGRASAPKAAKAPKAAATASPSPTSAVCGHRSMNGRTCTREPGHAAKSHRYT